MDEHDIQENKSSKQNISNHVYPVNPSEYMLKKLKLEKY